MKVVIMRGLPGSGKSTYVINKPGFNLTCSADDFHMVDGKYQYDPRRAGEAHNECLLKFLHALSNPCTGGREFDHLFVDNTNTQAWEIAPYYRLAEARQYPVKIVQQCCSVEYALKHQTHNVPSKMVWAMYQHLLMERLPSFWNLELVDGI